MVHDVSEFPGVAIYQGSVNPAPPNLSSTNWNAYSAYSGVIPDYAFFEGRVAASSLNTVTGNLDSAALAAGTPVDGYIWYKYDGAGSPLVIEDAGGVDIGSNRVVLFVKNADLFINSKINLTPGRGFFMAIVERDIIVDSVVGDPAVTAPTPDLEGIYITDGVFKTGAGTNQLHMRGSVVGNSGVSLERNLSDNSLYPGELFEYGIDQLLLFPGNLTSNRLTWREVAP